MRNILIGLFLLLIPGNIYANNPPDASHSGFVSNDSNQTPADGTTIAHMTLTLKDSSDNVLAGDSVSISIPSNSSVNINPTSATLDSSGTANFEFKSNVSGTFPIDVTDNGTTLTGLGQVIFINTSVCSDPAPGSAPKLTKAEYIGTGQIKLTWEKAADPVTYYLLAYGIKSGDYIYGDPNIGGHDKTSYTVSGLVSGKKYYFVVRAGNGCTPGTFSNELSQTASAPVINTPAPVIKTPVPNIEDTPAPTAFINNEEEPSPSPSEEAVSAPVNNSSFSIDKLVTLMTAAGIIMLVIYLYWTWKEKKKQQRPPSLPQNQPPQLSNNP